MLIILRMFIFFSYIYIYVFQSSPRHYCVIENPAVRDKDGKVVIDSNGQVKLLHSDIDLRFSQEPFPLYPGETLKHNVTPLKVIEPNCALRLRAVLDFFDDQGQKIRAGDEFLFPGPGRKNLFNFLIKHKIRIDF